MDRWQALERPEPRLNLAGYRTWMRVCAIQPLATSIPHHHRDVPEPSPKRRGRLTEPDAAFVRGGCRCHRASPPDILVTDKRL
jgi:hypothetical protein